MISHSWSQVIINESHHLSTQSANDAQSSYHQFRPQAMFVSQKLQPVNFLKHVVEENTCKKLPSVCQLSVI